MLEELIGVDQETERLKKLPYLFRGISNSKFKYSLEHAAGTPRPDHGGWFGQWSETLGQACSYALSHQHEQDRSYENEHVPGVVLVAQKSQIGDFKKWLPDRESLKHPDWFREYDSGREPRLADAEKIFVSDEYFAQLTPEQRIKLSEEVVIYSAEKVRFFRDFLHFGAYGLAAEIVRHMQTQQGEFLPPMTQTGFPDNEQLSRLEFSVFQKIAQFEITEIKKAYLEYQNEYNHPDVKKMTQELLATLGKEPFLHRVDVLVGVLYFLQQQVSRESAVVQPDQNEDEAVSTS